MSTTQPIDSVTPTTAVPPSASGPSPGDPSSTPVDPLLIQQTKQHIRSLVNEITHLSQSDCTLEEFYDGFLNRLITALASIGGAIWKVGDEGNLDLRYQVNMAQARLTEDEDRQYQHSLLLRKVASSGESALVPPRSGSADEDEAGNPTDFLLVLGTIKIDNEVQAIVEIFQRPGGGPTTQRGYLRFLLQMCDLASDFLKNRQLRHFSDRQQLWDKLEHFIHTVHRSLDPRETVYTIANEGRRLIEADRVSVALAHGRKCRIEVVSGLDTIDRRAHEVKQLGKLATAVVRGGQPLWYDGDASDLPPQIERRLDQYVDKSHAKLISIVPLFRPADQDETNRGWFRRPIGALVVEQLKNNRRTDALAKRVDVVAEHSANALTNALEYNNLFLLPLWRALGKARLIVALRNLPKTLLAIAAIVGLVAWLCLVPADFDLSATGTLHPSVRRDVFARVDGTLVDVPVEPGQTVERGQILARLENTQLEAEIIGLQGSKTETEKQLVAINRTLLDNPNMSSSLENQMSGQMAQLRESAASIDRQLEIYREQLHQLVITSPVDGQVVTWQVRDKLLQRPVQRGQILMTVVDPSSDWELELDMPERRMGHVDQAAREFDGELKVTFILATHPGEEFVGRIVEFDRTADVRDDNGNTVRLRVAIDKSELPDLRDGAKVSARVHCGHRSFGYVWFHELIETVQAKVLFWF